MVPKNKGSRHVERYKKFLNLYPKTHRERFAEPMLQTFTDMLNDHLKSSDSTNDSTWIFVSKVYLDTTKEIIIEHSKEMVMNIKSQRSKVLIGSRLVILIVIVSFIAYVGYNKYRNSRFIPLYSTVEDARAISKGQKAKCLPDNQQAVDDIKKDDVFEEYENDNGEIIQFSMFETNVVAGFLDIPAGTNAEVTKNQYDGQIASGSIVYEQDYGSYNYTAKKVSGNGQWELVSLLACEM